jgi:hypothetical protein
MAGTLTPVNVDSEDTDPVGASAYPGSPTAYPGLMYPGQSTPLPPDALTASSSTKGTLIPH